MHCLGWCPITTNHCVSTHRVSQAILLDCRNFDPDAKKGTSRDVEAGCVLAKFEKGQRKHHNIYNNIENDRNELHLSQKKVLCFRCRYHILVIFRSFEMEKKGLYLQPDTNFHVQAP